MVNGYAHSSRADVVAFQKFQCQNGGTLVLPYHNAMLLQQRMFQVAGLQNAESEAEGRSV